MTAQPPARLPSGILLGGFVLRQVWRYGRWPLLLMVFAQFLVGIFTGVGIAAMLAALGEPDLPFEVTPLILVLAGTGALLIAASSRYVTTTVNFRLRWRIQARLAELVLERLRSGPPLALQPPLRATSVASLAAAAGGDAAHAAWFSQLLLNGLVPSVTAAILTVVVGVRNPWLLMPIAGLVLALIPLLWVQSRRVSRAASDFYDAGPERSKGMRAIVRATLEGSGTDAEVHASVERFESARMARMLGVQRLQFGTGVLVAVAIGGSVLALVGATASAGETVVYVAMLREGLAAFAGVAAAAGSAARLQPRSERLRRILEPRPVRLREMPGSVVVHGVVRPDPPAMCSTLVEWFGGDVVASFETVDDEGTMTIRWKQGGTATVRGWDRKPWRAGENRESALHLAITAGGEVISWEPSEGAAPDLGTASEISAAESGEEPDEEEEIF